MFLIKRISLVLWIALVVDMFQVQAQPNEQPNSAEIYHQLKKLNKLGKVLYIAAHPDDENTRLIAYLANEELLDVAYLSLTRGDGGQNVIGTEIREELGVLRTQELLEARKIDGGRQFFSTANDFGFSKHPDETFQIWDKEQVLRDMVWIIRNFQPDYLITRFSTKPGITHGHHTASAILAEEAFEAAADPTRFPKQLKDNNVTVWQAQALLFNVYKQYYEDFDNHPDKAKMLTYDVGKYNPVLGTSYTEMAAHSRSQHKCQAMGEIGTRGTKMEYLLPIKGSVGKSLFDSQETDWSRIKGTEKVQENIQKAIDNYEVNDPSSIIPHLVKALSELDVLKLNKVYVHDKRAALHQLIKDCLGLYVSVWSDQPTYVLGEDAIFEVEAVNRSNKELVLRRGLMPNFANDSTDVILQSSQKQNQVKFSYKTSSFDKISQPYWLEESWSLGNYEVKNLQSLKFPANHYSRAVMFNLSIDGTTFHFFEPVLYRWKDDVAGELHRPVVLTPPATINFTEKAYIFSDDVPQKVSLKVKNWEQSSSGSLSLQMPDGWTVSPKQQPFSITEYEGEAILEFDLTAPKTADKATIKAVLTIADKEWAYAFVEVNYPHITPQVIFPQSEASVIKLDVKKEGDRIGYIVGAGDYIPQALEQIGYTVIELSDDEITLKRLQDFDAIVLGVRVFNTRTNIVHKTNALWEYVAKGGTFIHQYTTTYSLLTDEISPIPFTLSRERITDEKAPLEILVPDHPIFNTPNQLTQADFDGWVQERGLYFATDWDQRFTPLLSGNDVGEPGRKGGLLVAEYGEGKYVYLGYSLFRQLPAGVPGAYRLLANLVSY